MSELEFISVTWYFSEIALPNLFCIQTITSR